jgi:hypothetical protein
MMSPPPWPPSSSRSQDHPADQRTGLGAPDRHHPPRRGRARPLPAASPDRGRADLSSIHPRSGRSGVDGDAGRVKTFISQAACLSMRGSADLFGLPQGGSQADSSEDPRGGPVGGGLKAHGTLWESYDLARGNNPLPQQTRAARASHAVAIVQAKPSPTSRCRSKSAVCCDNTEVGGAHWSVVLRKRASGRSSRWSPVLRSEQTQPAMEESRRCAPWITTDQSTSTAGRRGAVLRGMCVRRTRGR